MSFDLYSQESDARIGSLPRITKPEPGAWDNFLLGTGSVAMRGTASAGRAASLAFSAIPIAIDKAASLTSGREITVSQDSFFADVHDPIFGRAVDYWTPKPGEVGAAAEIAGSVLSLLPLAIASPAAAVAAVQLGTAEDLSNKGVSTGKAMAVGAVQAAGLGLGIWMPILGQNLWQRTLLGGAGFNVLQGAATRGASGVILEDTPAAKDYRGFDGTAITLDVIMGIAFGGLAHVSPGMRAQGDAAWKKIEAWTGTLKPSDVDAIMALRQAQHLNVDSAPGKPADLPDLDAHVTAMRQAIDDLVNDRPVNVEEIVSGTKFEPDPERVAFQRQMADELEAQAREESAIADAEESARVASLPDVVDEIPPMREFKATSLLQEIRRKGGIQLDQIRDLTGEGRVGKGRKGLQPGLFTKNGQDLGDLATQLHDEGWDINVNEVDGGVQHLRDRIQSELAGDKQYSISDMDRLAMHEYEVRMFEESGAHLTEAERAAAFELATLHIDKAPRDWSILSEEAKNAHLDELFGADTNPAASGKKSGAGTVSGEARPQGDAEAIPGTSQEIAAAGAKPVDPLASEAARFAGENPDLPIRVGEDADGNAVTKSAKQYLQNADDMVARANEDAKLFEIAAGCMLGVR